MPTNLNTLIPPDSPLQLLTACGINDRGEITGQAQVKSTAEFVGYLLKPVSGSSSEPYVCIEKQE